jgi:hypothetical protein
MRGDGVRGYGFEMVAQQLAGGRPEEIEVPAMELLTGEEEERVRKR